MKKLNQLRLTLASALLASLGFCGCRSINESVKDDRQQEKEYRELTYRIYRG